MPGRGSIELYPTPAPRFYKPREHPLPQSSTSDHHSPAPFIPLPGSDIFKTPLPAHRSGKWNSAEKPSDRSTLSPKQTRLQHPSPPTEYPDTHGAALLLPERSLNLRKDVPGSQRAQAANKPSNQAAADDWRYDAVEIESIDMETKVKGAAGGGGGGGLHTKAVYLPSDPKTTEVGWGVVHLYRDTEESAVLGDDATLKKSLDREQAAFKSDDCTTLCILAVPSWMMPSDLLGFVGDQAAWEDVSHFRLIRTGRANKYMVLMKFRSAKKARDWQKAHNGRHFSAAEPENCHVVYIKSVKFVSSPSSDSSTTAVSNFPHNTHDPFTSTALSSKPHAPPPPNLLELPTCPVCLERMDETTGLLTILCQHVFHCACLEKWRGSGCPVCRYTHSPSYTFPYPRPAAGVSEDEPETVCSTCGATANLWVCLICGNLGCGRYDSAHAYAHYEATSHCYAMDVAAQRVWDYAGDGYVHRLIQSKPSNLPDAGGRGGKSGEVERERHANEAFRAEGEDSVPREKMESMAAEYTYLLTSQLEGQRRYFEELVRRASEKASAASARAEEAVAGLAKVRGEWEEAQGKATQADEEVVRLRAAAEKAAAARGKSETLSRESVRQLKEERTMAQGLLERVKVLEGVEGKLKEEKRELEEMNWDLTQFVSGREKVEALQAQGEEVVDEGVKEGKGKKGKGKKK